MIPLLQSPVDNQHTTLIMPFMNVNGAMTERDIMKDITPRRVVYCRESFYGIFHSGV
ncbi:hypothetical protein BJX63DRAFT_410794 [Aspergillus granulosus]|uniref:Uncharacterized protein n=1 Tax=Aspergillus granulosus TaxID=176169 RepID=A0ABR4GZG2_9EURO